MKRLVILSLLVFLILMSCSLTGDKNIAIVAGNKVSVEELYKYIPPSEFESFSTEEKESLVRQICDDYLTRYFLEDRGVLDSGDVYWEIETWEVRELANGAYQHLVIDKIMNDKTMRDLYNKLKYELNISHLLIAHNAAQRQLNERDEDEALLLVNKIADSINVDNFNDYVMKYSDDVSKEENSGNLGWGSSGTWVESFENVAYALEPGEISEPVKTEFGYHIIKLNERRETNVEPFEKMRDELIDIAYNRWRTKFSLRQAVVFDSLSTARPLVLDDSLVTDFIDRFIRLSVNVFYSDQFTTFDILDVFEDSLTVGYLGETPIDKRWIYKYSKLVSIQRPNRFDSEKSFRSFVEQNRLGDLLSGAAINLGLNKSDDYIKTKNVYLAKKSASLFDKLYVFEKINPAPQQLRDFYEEKKGEIYRIEDRVRVREVLLEDSLTAAEILERINNGEDIGDLATQYSIRNMGKKNRGEIPAVKKTQYGEMGIAAFNMRDGEVGGPFKVGEYYSVIKREGYIPASYRSYNDILYRLLTDYRSHHMPEKRLEQKKMLHNKYSVRINRSFIK